MQTYVVGEMRATQTAIPIRERLIEVLKARSSADCSEALNRK